MIEILLLPKKFMLSFHFLVIDTLIDTQLKENGATLKRTPHADVIEEYGCQYIQNVLRTAEKWTLSIFCCWKYADVSCPFLVPLIRVNFFEPSCVLWWFFLGLFSPLEVDKSNFPDHLRTHKLAFLCQAIFSFFLSFHS